MIERRGPRRLIVQDCRSKNGTWIDDSAVDTAELPFSAVLCVGATVMVPVTASGAGGRTLHDFLRATARRHGSVRRAARALGMSRSTLADWLRTGRR
jgi:transcriptional regulator of acetoin/glycerol metabolism